MNAREAMETFGGLGDPLSLRFDLRRDLVATTDATGHLTSLNRAWEGALGWTREELMSRPFAEFLHPDDVEWAMATLARMSEGDLEVAAFENRFRRKDGSWAWLRWNARTDGLIWVGVAIDVTAEREAEERITQAIAEDRLLVYAQPILDRRTKAPVQEELLVRLREDGAVLAPAAFLPAAERSGAITKIDRWMVDRAFELADTGRRVAVNLSPRTIGDAELMADVCELLGERAAGDCRVSFEITETAALANVPAARTLALQLTGLDCELALDDFGTGSASFIHLRELPVDTIKIDRSFVMGLGNGGADHAVCHAVTVLAHELGLATVAEGVEDETILEQVTELEIDRVQGYLFGRPAPV